ncbi:MAG: hypothetical protein J0I45_18950 [Bosea sp.]|nr:hypothetical protein [Bosea sp. (in: a-proteobacteria)]
MAVIGRTLREQLAEQALFGFETASWGGVPASGRRTISRRGGKEPPMEDALLDEGAILNDLNRVETAAAEVAPQAGEDQAEA